MCLWKILWLNSQQQQTVTDVVDPRGLKAKMVCNFRTKLGNSVQNSCCGRKERDDVSITIMGWSNAVHRNNLRILHNSCSDGAQRLSVLVCLTTFNAVTAAIHDCGDLEFQGGNYCRVWILRRNATMSQLPSRTDQTQFTATTSESFITHALTGPNGCQSWFA